MILSNWQLDTTLKTQDGHTESFNNNGDILLSIADYYNAAKSKDKILLNLVDSHLNKHSHLLTSDKAFHEENSSQTTVITHYGSTVITPTKKTFSDINYNHTFLKDILKEPTGLIFLQTLLETTDSSKEIIDVFWTIFGTNEFTTYFSFSKYGPWKFEPEKVLFLYRGPEHINHEEYTIFSLGFGHPINTSPAISAKIN